MIPAADQPPAIHVTHRAIERYQERVCNLPDDRVIELITSSPVVQRAVAIGAPFVKLGGGQRLVLVDARVITVLPKDHYAAALDRRRPPLPVTEQAK